MGLFKNSRKPARRKPARKLTKLNTAAAQAGEMSANNKAGNAAPEQQEDITCKGNAVQADAGRGLH